MRAREEQAPALVAQVAIPPGAITVAPAPALWGAACASYLGMTPELARRTLAGMAEDPAFRGHVVYLSRRPRELAAAPGDVLRYLRTRASAGPEVAPANEVAPPPRDGADAVLQRALARGRR